MSKCVSAHLGMSLLLWLFGLPSALTDSRQGCAFFYFLPQNEEHKTGKEKDFFRTALAIPQLEVYIIDSSLPEKWDRRILTFFSVSYNRNLEHFYNTDRSKACQCAYLRILACLCLRCCGLSKCLVIRRQGCAFFVFCHKTRNIHQERKTIFPHAACKIKRKVYINGDRRSGEKDLCKKTFISVWFNGNLETSA